MSLSATKAPVTQPDERGKQQNHSPWYCGVRIYVRQFRQYGHLRRWRYTLRPGDERPMWVVFQCTTAWESEAEAQRAAREAVDERIWHEQNSPLFSAKYSAVEGEGKR